MSAGAFKADRPGRGMRDGDRHPTKWRSVLWMGSAVMRRGSPDASRVWASYRRMHEFTVLQAVWCSGEEG